MFERIFKLSEHKTTVKTEVMAGITTFMTMAYILAVNPSVLGSTGMDTTAVLLATALASCLGTLCMAFMANLPFALSAGMGLNAFMAYTVVAGYGYSWQVALLAVFIEGLIFIVLSLTNVREAIFNAIPLTLKKGVSVGIGLFIAFIGLQNSGLCVDSATLVGIISFPENFHTAGICALLTLIGLFFTAVFYTRKMKGAILYGILLTWILGMLCQVTGLYVPTPDAGFYSLFPSWGMTDFSKLGLTFGQCFNVDFSAVGIVNFIVVIFSFLFVDIFDTLGTLIGVATKAKMLDKDGKLPGIKPALLADSIATSAGAILGTSTTTTFVESASGVAVGGRTGLTARHRRPVPRFHAVRPDLHRDPVLRDGSGADHGRLPDGRHGYRDQLRSGQPHRVHPGIPRHHRDAAVLQHLRGHLSGRYLLCPAQPRNRQGQEGRSADVRPGSAVRTQVYLPVITIQKISKGAALRLLLLSKRLR